MARPLRTILIVLGIIAVLAAIALWVLTRPDVADFTAEQTSGRVPQLDEPAPQSVPTVDIAKAVGWPNGARPRAAAGLQVAPFATGLSHPRSMLVLPNGDVLVAESNAPKAKPGGIKDWIMGKLMARAGAGVPSANRITILRDADGDGRAEARAPYLTGLNSPFGMALVGDALYVANTDSVMAFPYVEDASRITAKGTRLVNLPATKPNQHWTRDLIASPDGSKLYAAVGSNSNIGENGIETERCVWQKGFPPEFCRAAVLEIDIAKRRWRPFASGLRNPTGLAFLPGSEDLWAIVNERDMLGSDLVPDYMAQVSLGDYFGWPYYYWGGYEDKRVSDSAPADTRQYTKRPEYGLGSHTAPLGISFSQGAALGPRFSNGAFVSLHGSWNRSPPSGYKVVFVRFGGSGRPAEAKPVEVLGGFLNGELEAQGRPVGVRIAGDGALLVADDVGNTVWRVSAAGVGSPPRQSR